MKASSPSNGGLLNKLAVCLGIVNELEHTKAVAQLWREFLLELRFRYESCFGIPGLCDQSNESSCLTQPDLSRCLLHQKLQMLNCCIKKRIERQKQDTCQAKKTNESEEDEEDNFYDCEDEQSQLAQPEGRLKKFGNLTLLKRPSEALYVPITQVKLLIFT